MRFDFEGHLEGLIECAGTSFMSRAAVILWLLSCYLWKAFRLALTADRFQVQWMNLFLTKMVGL